MEGAANDTITCGALRAMTRQWLALFSLAALVTACGGEPQAPGPAALPDT